MTTIMIDKITNHPAVQNAQDISDICSPLKQLDISYFCHVRIDKDKNFSALSNNPGFHEHYLKHKYHNADIHLSDSNALGNTIIWDLIDCDGQSLKMNKEAEEFGIRHTFTIVDKNKSNNDYYHFSTHIPGASINQKYMHNMDLLKLFILQFNDKVAQSKTLSKAYNIHFKLDEQPSGFTLTSENVPLNPKSRDLFLQALKLNTPPTSTKPLSLKELEVLSWLHNGKTLEQIALILGISTIMVKKHIAVIKEKTNRYTQFQLGEYFSSIGKI